MSLTSLSTRAIRDQGTSDRDSSVSLPMPKVSETSAKDVDWVAEDYCRHVLN